jgi:hypothetical protein
VQDLVHVSLVIDEVDCFKPPEPARGSHCFTLIGGVQDARLDTARRV